MRVDDAERQAEIDPFERDPHSFASAQLDRYRWIARWPQWTTLDADMGAQALGQRLRGERSRSDELGERLEPESYLCRNERARIHSIPDDDQYRRPTAQERPELAETTVEFRAQRAMRWEIEYDQVERSGQ